MDDIDKLLNDVTREIQNRPNLIWRDYLTPGDLFVTRSNSGVIFIVETEMYNDNLEKILINWLYNIRVDEFIIMRAWEYPNKIIRLPNLEELSLLNNNIDYLKYMAK